MIAQSPHGGEVISRDDDALWGAMAGAGVPVLVGHHRRHNPRIKAVREMIAKGQIGQLTAVVGLWLLKKPDSYFDVAWRREPGGGPILINLVHDIDDLRFICGEIVEVQALTSNSARGFAAPAAPGSGSPAGRRGCCPARRTR